MKKIPFYHTHLDILDSDEVLHELDKYLSSKTNHTIFFLNAHCFNIAVKDQKYRNVLSMSDLVLNDGVGVEIACRLKSLKLKENLNGTNLIPKMMEFIALTNKKVFLLGSSDDIAAKAKINISRKIPQLDIAGALGGYFQDDVKIINEINDSGAAVLIVGMGVPLQEKWIMSNRHSFTSVKVFIAGGAIIDFAAEKFKRAPLWLQKARLEWLYRFFQEPVRLFKRYFIGNILFFINLIKFR